jgi:hypothetical protein
MVTMLLILLLSFSGNKMPNVNGLLETAISELSNVDLGEILLVTWQFFLPFHQCLTRL